MCLCFDGKSASPAYDVVETWFSYESSGIKRADVFYVHPTTHIGLCQWNIAWEGMGSTCTGPIAGDPDLLQGQAGAWRNDCNLYAPKYSQAGFLSQCQNLNDGSDDVLEKVQTSLKLAFDDVSRAFLHFLDNRPDQKRPFFVAGHSQGAVLLSKVLADFVEGTIHEDTFVAGYLCGGYCPMDLFNNRKAFVSIKPCTSPEDTNCIISYDTRTTDWKPESLNKIGFGLGVWPHHMYWLLFDRYCEKPVGLDNVSKPRLQINPLTWNTEGGGNHLGVNLSYQNRQVAPLIPPAGWSDTIHITDKAVIIEDPESWLPGAGSKGGPGNLHPIDVHFFYHNIRENVGQRLNAWYNKRVVWDENRI